MAIDTKILNKLDITMSEYRLCEIIARNQYHNGYCRLEKKVLAKNLGLSEIYTFKMIRDLINKGLLARHPSRFRRGLLRVTHKWEKVVKEWEGTRP